MRTHAAQLGDYLLTTYIQAWVAHALGTHPSQILNMNMLYPSRHILAASENLIGNQVLFAPVYALTGNPILAANAVTFSSFFLCGLAMYLLVRCLTGRRTSAAVAGFIYAFSPPRISQLPHSQLLSMQWIPLAVLFLFLFLFHKKKSSLLAFCGFVLLQILCSLYLGYFAVLTCLVFFAAIILVRPDLVTRRALGSLLLGAIAVAVLLFPLLRPYREMQKDGVFPANLLPFATAASAAPLASYLDNGGGSVAHVYTRVLSRFRSTRFDWEKVLFPGFLPVILALVLLGGCVYLLKANGRAHTKRYLQEMGGDMMPSLVMGAVLLVLMAYVLSLGPYLWIHGHPTRIRLPFFWLSQWVPGLSMFRVPARFGLVVTFGLAILAGLGFSLLLTYSSRWAFFRTRVATVALTLLIIAGMAVEFNSTPFPSFPVMVPPRIPEEYTWLAKQPADTPIVELPIQFRGAVAEPSQQVGYMYASIFHWQPLVNGYTGYEPPQSQELMRIAARLPLPSSAAALGKVGVRYVLVHEDRLSAAERQQWKHLPSGIGLLLTKTIGDSFIYRIDPQQAALAAQAPLDPALCPAVPDPSTSFILHNPDHTVSSTLKNTGFENGSLFPWIRSSGLAANITADLAHNGTHSLAEEGGGGSIYEDAGSLEPGRAYTVAAWVLASAATTATAQLAVYDPSTDVATFSALNSCTPGWQLLSVPITVGKLGSIRIHLFRNPGAGTIYWDDVAIYRQH